MTFRILEDRNMPTATPTPTWQASQPAHVARDVPPVLPHTGFVRESRLLLFLPFSHSTLCPTVSAQTLSRRRSDFPPVAGPGGGKTPVPGPKRRGGGARPQGDAPVSHPTCSNG